MNMQTLFTSSTVGGGSLAIAAGLSCFLCLVMRIGRMTNDVARLDTAAGRKLAESGTEDLD